MSRPIGLVALCGHPRGQALDRAITATLASAREPSYTSFPGCSVRLASGPATGERICWLIDRRTEPDGSESALVCTPWASTATGANVGKVVGQRLRTFPPPTSQDLGEMACRLVERVNRMAAYMAARSE